MNAFSPFQNLRQVYLSAGETEARLTVIRQRTHTGRPLGTEEFIQDLEKVTQRRIALQKRGPREKLVTDRRQGELHLRPVEASLSPKYQSRLTTKFRA
jgi:hypothetical protein